jgi:uncharacterized protein
MGEKGTNICPHGVNIPLNFELYNEATLFQGSTVVLCRKLYHGLPESERAAACQACGAGEQRCPQDLEIGRLLEDVTRQFSLK